MKPPVDFVRSATTENFLHNGARKRGVSPLPQKGVACAACLSSQTRARPFCRNAQRSDEAVNTGARLTAQTASRRNAPSAEMDFCGRVVPAGNEGGAQVGFFELTAALFERGLQAGLPARSRERVLDSGSGGKAGVASNESRRHVDAPACARTKFHWSRRNPEKARSRAPVPAPQSPIERQTSQGTLIAVQHRLGSRNPEHRIK